MARRLVFIVLCLAAWLPVFVVLRQTSHSTAGAGSASLSSSSAPALLAQARVDALDDPLPEGVIARLGTTRMRHSLGSHLSCITWSPDGNMIATTSHGDKKGVEARLWEASTGKPLSLLENNTSYGPFLVRFTPDNKALAGTAADKIVLWDTATGKELGQFVGHQAEVQTLTFQDAGKTMVSVSRDGVVQWWDMAERKSIRQWNLLADDPEKTDKGVPIVTRWIENACLSADGKFLAFNKLWETEGEKVYHTHTATVADLTAQKELWHEDRGVATSQFAFTPDGKQLGVSYGTAVGLRETVDGRRIADSEYFHDCVWTMDFSPDGNTLAVCVSGGVAFWSPNEKAPVRKVDVPIHGGGYNVFDARPAFSPDGKRLAIDRKLSFQILDVATGKPAVSWPSYDEDITKLAFSADGRSLLAADHFIDTGTWRERPNYQYPSRKFRHARGVSLDHTLCLAEDGDHPDTVFDTGTGRVVAHLEAPDRDRGRHQGFFSPRAGLYVMQDRACEGTEVDTLFAIPSGKRLCRFSFKKGTAGWSFSADDSRAAFFETETKTIHVHETSTGKLLWKFAGTESLAMSPNGKMLAAWTERDGYVRLLDLRTGKEGRSLVLEQKPEKGHDPCLAWSADGRLLAVEGPENSIRIWEAASGQPRREFRGHQAAVNCLAFSADGQLLASASEDTTLLIWQTLPETKRRFPLTEDELAARWDNLAADAGKACTAQADLLHEPKSTITFLAKHLEPAPAVDLKQVTAWIQDLDSDEFRVRTKATEELERQSDLARELIKNAIAANPSLETRCRLEDLLDKMNKFSPSQLRCLRAIEILEGVGTPEALQILERLAQGNPESIVTAESRTVIARIKKNN